MKPIIIRCAAVVALIASVASAQEPGTAVTTAKPPAENVPGQDVFGLTKIHQFHLELTAKEWEKMQPAGGMPGFFGGFGRGPGGPSGAAQHAAKPDDEPIERHKGGSFGMEFPWARAELTAEDTTYSNLGLRYKGGGSYLASMGRLKRNLKVKLDHYDSDQRFHGLKSINLNAGAADPTRLREALAFAVYREAGVPAPRTAFAEVTLTVPGKYDKELLGLYTVIEQVDKKFLMDRFGNSKGLLMKPEVRPGRPPGVFGYLGDDWEPYKAAVGPKDEPSKKEAERVIEFAKLISRADDEQFEREIGSYLDVDEFLRFLAVTAMVSNMDSFFTGGHNCYIYLNPETARFVFIPWDLDLAFAGFPMMGSPDQLMELSLTKPYGGGNRLVDRLLAITDVREKYQQLLADLAANCFTKEKLLQNIEVLEQATQQIIAQETMAAESRKEGGGGFGFGPPGGMFGRTPDLRTFAEKRTESVATQLAGKTKGYVPAGGFGFGAPPGMLGSNVMLLAMPEVGAEVAVRDDQQKQAEELCEDLQEQIRSSFANINFEELPRLSAEERQKRFEDSRKKTEEATKEADGRLSRILDAEQLERLNQLRLQREGVAAFARPEVAKQLGLSDEQQSTIRSIQEASRPQFGGGPGGFGPPDFARIEQQRQKARADILEVLTDDQKAKWTAMTGKEFKFPTPQFGGFGPGGPGARPGSPGGDTGERRGPEAKKKDNYN